MPSPLMSRVCSTEGQPRNLLSENSLLWLVSEVRASCMPDEAYSSDIFGTDMLSSILVRAGLAADGHTDSAGGPLSSVALDFGCADRDTFSRRPVIVTFVGTQVVATGVGPGVGPGVGSPAALW